MTLGDIGSLLAALVAAGALVVAGFARRDSRRSAAASEASASSSERSADAAERTLALSELEARRKLERSDVEWSRENKKSDGGVVTYRNIGSDTAYEVSAVLTVNGSRFDLRFGDVPPGEIITHDARQHF